MSSAKVDTAVTRTRQFQCAFTLYGIPPDTIWENHLCVCTGKVEIYMYLEAGGHSFLFPCLTPHRASYHMEHDIDSYEWGGTVSRARSLQIPWQLWQPYSRCCCLAYLWRHGKWIRLLFTAAHHSCATSSHSIIPPATSYLRPRE